MNHPLTGRAAVADFHRLRIGDRLTVVLDGSVREELELSLTEIKPLSDNHRDQAWIYGIDPLRRVRLVFVRSAPQPWVGRAAVIGVG